MKILLVRPPAPNKLSFTKVLDNEPLELEYLHTAIRGAGYEDYIYDALTETSGIEAVLRRERPDVVAITGYITQENLMLEYAALAKKLDNSVSTILGGVHAQLNYRRLYSDGVDYIARSESMEAFVQLLQHIERGEGEPSAINGLCYRRGDGYAVNPYSFSHINELPIPDRSHYDRFKKHYRYLDLTEVATVKTSASCPYSCSFCYCTLLNGGRYMARDIARVVEEIEGISGQNIQIVDDDFMVSRERLAEFARLIKERGIRKSFICYARADFISRNEDMVALLREIGFKYFLVGLEAVSNEELESYNKKTSVDENRRCVEIIARSGAHCIALLIVPIEATRRDFENIYHWVVENGLKYVTVSIFTPIPGTPLYEEYRDKLISSNIEDWDFLHLVMEPLNMTRTEFYFEYYKLFIKLYKLARAEGIYDFMDLAFFKGMLADYLRRKIRGE